MKEPQRDGPYLLLRFGDKHGDRSWTIYAVQKEEGKIRNYRDTDPYADFEIHCYLYASEDGYDAFKYDPEEKKAEPCYGWSIGFKPYRVELSQAESMAKVLRRIENELKKQSEEYGSPSKFSDFALRVAKAIKAKGFLRHVRDLNNGQWGYDSAEHRDLTPSEAKWFIESTNREYIKKLFPENNQAAA